MKNLEKRLKVFNTLFSLFLLLAFFLPVNTSGDNNTMFKYFTNIILREPAPQHLFSYEFLMTCISYVSYLSLIGSPMIYLVSSFTATEAFLKTCLVIYLISALAILYMFFGNTFSINSSYNSNNLLFYLYGIVYVAFGITSFGELYYLGDEPLKVKKQKFEEKHAGVYLLAILVTWIAVSFVVNYYDNLIGTKLGMEYPVDYTLSNWKYWLLKLPIILIWAPAYMFLGVALTIVWILLLGLIKGIKNLFGVSKPQAL